MHHRDVAADKILRRAMGRAGVVVAYQHRCRRHGCGFNEERRTAEPSRCLRCGFALWAKPLPRHVRFHDLRHTTATLLLKEGVPLAVVQRVMRHSDPALTADTYGHLDLEDMRRGLDRLTFEVEQAPTEGRVLRRSCGPWRDRKTKAPRPIAFARNLGAFRWSGRQDLNLRPLAPQASALPGCATPRKPCRDGMSSTGRWTGQRRRGSAASAPSSRPPVTSRAAPPS